MHTCSLHRFHRCYYKLYIHMYSVYIGFVSLQLLSQVLSLLLMLVFANRPFC